MSSCSTPWISLEQRYVAGEFVTGTIAFDPTSPNGDGNYSLVGAYDALRDKFVRSLAPAMYQPVKPT